jgi:putative phage-type endonuclease
MLDRAEFLQRRKSGIGGSDVAAVMGVSKYRTPVDIWRDKISDEINLESNDILDLASYLEEYTAQRYAAVAGHKVRRLTKELIHKDFPFLKSNIDREICLDKRGVGILECKALSNFNFRKVEMYGLPDDYTAQIQHQFLTGNGVYKWGAFAIINRDNGKLLTFEILPDLEFHKEIIRICVPFWTECVEKRIQPVADVAEMGKVSIAPAYTGAVVDLTGDTELNELIAQRIENVALVDEAKALLQQTDALIAEKLADYEAVECKGARIYYKSSVRTTIDSTRLKKERPEIYKEFSKTSETSRSLKFYQLDNRTNF